MSVPRNNLAEILKRQESNTPTNTPSYSPAPGSNSTKKHKFKPAVFISLATTPSSKSTKDLPIFPGSSFKPIRPIQRTDASNNKETIPPSHESDPATPNPLKRNSSDPDVVSDPSPPLPKRPKKTEEASNKENRSPAGNVVGLDYFNPSHDLPTKDAVGYSQLNLHRQNPNSDLLELSSGQLEELRVQDLNLLRFILDHMRNHNTGDQVILQRFQKQLNERLEAIDLTKARKVHHSASMSNSVACSSLTLGPGVLRSPKPSPILTDRNANTLEPTTTTQHKDTQPKTIDVPVEPVISSLAPGLVHDSDDEYWDSVGDLCDNAIQTLNHAPTSQDYSRERQSPYYNEIRHQLSSVFKLKNFRPNQLEAITATMEGRDVFVLMPTGGGKSLCYQLPAVCKTGKTKGVTIVVSPLTALMEDQVNALKKKGVDAFFWNADSLQQEVKTHLWSGKKPSLLYVTPEKLRGSSACRNLLHDLYQKQQLARFAIDEAHCISTWGQDFRSAYKELGRLRADYPSIPIIALTATATPRTHEDIVNQLHLRNPACFTQSFNRANLKYIVKNKKNAIEDIVDFIQREHSNHSGIVYCLARKTCENVAKKLQDRNLAACFYHAGLSKEEKNHLLGNWQNNTFRIIVATIAFGMGIDKADVRFVIHYDLPNSLSNYYQETGRAGRDGNPADCVLYYQYKSFLSICRMIENDRDREEPLTPEAIERQKDAAHGVLKYCTNISECRRVQVLRYFGQEFHQRDCNRGCDNCQDDRELVTQNVKPIVLSTITILRALSDRGEKITQSQLICILRGANRADFQRRGFDKLKGFGDAKASIKELVELTLDNMLVQEILVSTLQVNSRGYSNEYLKLGSGAFTLESNEPFEVKWRPPTKGNPKLTKQPSRRKSGLDNNTLNNPDPIEDFSDGDDIAPQTRDDVGTSHQPEGLDEDLRSMKELYEKLDALRDQIRIQQNLRRKTDVVSEDVLQDLSYTCPQDYQELRDIMDHASPDLFPHFHNARNQFLHICFQHRYGTKNAPPFSNSQLHSRFEFQKP